MVEIRSGEFHETADLSGLSVAEARKQFKDEFGIPDNAHARINGRKVNSKLEAETYICDNDKLAFAAARGGKGIFLVGALLLALAATGSVFAYGYLTQSTSLNAVAAGGDFAQVTVNNSNLPNWTPYGMFKGSIEGGPIFNVNTASSQYTGDLVVTVSLANGDDLVKAYRVLALFVEMRNSHNNICDINADSENNSQDFALLTLGNGAIDMYLNQGTSYDYYSIEVTGGFYVSHIWGASGWSGYENPLLYCEVAQR